jgi:hypothetical protein
VLEEISQHPTDPPYISSGIVVIANRPKNIRIHLAIFRVRFHLLRFNSSGNFCDGGRDLLQRNSLSESAPQALELAGQGRAPLQVFGN